MSFDKNLFSEHLNNKDYSFCISLLRNEIIDILTKRVQEKDSTLVFLKKSVFMNLSDVEKDVVTELNSFGFEENPSYFELSRMMELYKDLL